jgi:signal transduction histidine kinase
VIPKDDVLTARFPRRFLTLTVILTGGVLVWLGWGSYRSFRVAEMTWQRDFRIEELRGTIIHLDEVLTMSARMAVATGEQRWEERYRRYEPQLDAAIKEAMSLSPEVAGSEAATQTDLANIKLVEMENQAFALVRQGRLPEARAVLFSTEYETQKHLYAEGMTELADLLNAAAGAGLRAEQKRAFLSVVAAVIVISALLIAWLVVLQTMRDWRMALLANNRQLAQQADELKELTQALDQKVADRTRELEASKTAALDMLKEAHEARQKAEQAEEAVLKEQQLLRELLSLQEQERKLVAYEIHDGFVQQATAALMNFQGWVPLRERDPEQAQKVCDQGLKLLSDSVAEARRLIGGLRPPILDELGVVPAIEYLVSESKQRGTVDIEFEHCVEFDRLLPPLETAVFRIAQECLTNALRHSQSGKVRIGLNQQGDCVRVKVEDWGIGFDVEKIGQDHFGLRGIRERARLLGGHVIIESTPGTGTCITVELPLVEVQPKERQIPSDTTSSAAE